MNKITEVVLLFSFNMIVDEMPDCRAVSAPAKAGMFDMLMVNTWGNEESVLSAVGTEEGRKESGVQTYLDAMEKMGSASLRVLVVGSMASSYQLLAANPSAYALVVLEQESFPAALEPYQNRCFALYSRQDAVPSVIVRVQLVCDRLQHWQERMKTALLEQGGYQRLIDCSESVLSNFISLTDSSFRLIAYTHGVAPQDDISRRLIQNGYHDMEAIALFKKNNLFERWKNETGLRVHEHPLTAETESASYIFRMQGTYFMHVVMRFNDRPRTKGLMDAFSIFISHLEILVRREWQGARMRGTSYTRTLIGLVSGKLTESTLIEEELAVAEIRRDSRFLVMCFSPNEKTQKTSENERAYYLKTLSMEFPQAKTVEYGETIIALFEMPTEGKLMSWETCNKFEQRVLDDIAAFLNIHGGLCGASNMMTSVYAVRYGYMQALYALSRCLSPVISPGEKASSFLTPFKEAYLDFLLYGRATNRELSRFCRENGIVERISADDKEEGTNNLEILVAYLLNERHATKAAKSLYMHRNSLIYRVEAVCKRYHLDFEYYAHRQAFLLEYHLMLERSLMR